MQLSGPVSNFRYPEQSERRPLVNAENMVDLSRIAAETVVKLAEAAVKLVGTIAVIYIVYRSVPVAASAIVVELIRRAMGKRWPSG